MKKRFCTSVILETLLIISIMLAIFSIFLKYVALDKNVYLKVLNESGVYGQVKDSVYKKIDVVLNAKKINIDIKESILTEDDIKREADTAISGIIDYLKTGENNVKPVDTDIYKQRIADILHSTIGNIMKPTNKDISFNDKLNIQNTAYIVKKPKLDGMVVVGQDVLKVDKLMTRDEAEAKVRELLKQKGLTVDQAIKKAKDKGLTEDQALKILAGYGITIDDNTGKNESNAEKDESDKANSKDSQNKLNDNNTSSVQSDDGNNKEVSPNTQEVKSSADKAVKSQLDALESKLLDEANSNIQKEVDKMNLSKVLESNKVQNFAKITSTIYKMFWVFMSLPAILSIMLILNSKELRLGFKQVGRAFLISGLIITVVFFSGYEIKIYDKININPEFIKETISYLIKHFCIVLSTYGIVTCAIGLFIFIPTVSRIRKQKKNKVL